MDILVVPKFGKLWPSTGSDADKIAKLTAGEEYKIKPVKPRNPRFHRKYFKLLDIVYNNLPEGFSIITPAGQEVKVRSKDDLLWHIKMQAGHYEQRVTMGGRITYDALSIDFYSMDDASFSDFYNTSIDIILKHFLKGAKRRELEEMVILEFS